MPILENAPVKPAESPYGNTKQIGEEIIKDTCKVNDGLNAISLRYFNPVGAHESAKIGELPLGVPQNLVPFITQTAAGLREQLSVFGDDYPTPDGTCIRDYIHVVDLALGHVRAIEELWQKPGCHTFNLGTGQGYSVLDMLQAFSKACNKKLPYKIAPRRAGDIAKCYADSTRAKSELGWQAEKSLEDMVQDTWRWQSNNPTGYLD